MSNRSVRGAFASIMASLDTLPDAAKEAAIADLLARTPVAPRDPLRVRILQMATAPEALLAALQLVLVLGNRRRA